MKKIPLIIRVRTSIFYAVLILVFFLLLGSLLGGHFGVIHSASLDMTGRMQSSIMNAVDYISSLKDNLIAPANLKQSNRLLKERKRRLLEDNEKYKNTYLEFRHLEELLQLKKELQIVPLSARITGWESSSLRRTVVIDKGRNDDIQAGMSVFTPQGIVGRIIQTGNRYAKVLLATAPTSTYDVIIQKSRVRGLLRGTGRNSFQLDRIPVHASVEKGDEIVTAGIGGVFHSGIPVGKVVDIQRTDSGKFYRIKITPAVNFLTLKSVIVDCSNRKQIIDSFNDSSIE